MNREVTVDIMRTGELRFIEKPETATLCRIGLSARQRISYVEPVNAIIRVAFTVLRRIVSDDSRAAAWSRKWKCRWRVRMIQSKVVFGCFVDRDEAIAAEVKYWNEIESLKGSS